MPITRYSMASLITGQHGRYSSFRERSKAGRETRQLTVRNWHFHLTDFSKTSLSDDSLEPTGNKRVLNMFPMHWYVSLADFGCELSVVSIRNKLSDAFPIAASVDPSTLVRLILPRNWSFQLSLTILRYFLVKQRGWFFFSYRNFSQSLARL